jgi:hypothetical protein
MPLRIRIGGMRGADAINFFQQFPPIEYGPAQIEPVAPLAAADDAINCGQGEIPDG